MRNNGTLSEGQLVRAQPKLGSAGGGFGERDRRRAFAAGANEPPVTGGEGSVVPP
jgi:hypothetical protein